MNNLKKVGVSALAGSLVAFAANAGELSVTGTANLTYTSEEIGPTVSSANNSGNPFGHASDLAFNGSGDVNGMTVSFFAAFDAGGASYASNSMTVDMGDMGKIKFDQGVGGNGVTAIDDKSPTAWEESWDGIAAGDGLTTTGSQNVFTYTNTIAGFGLNVAYDTEIDDSRTADGAMGAQGTSIDGSNSSFAITNATLVDGLDFGVGYGETSWDRESTTTTPTETTSVAAFANYAFGPVTVGLQQNYTSGTVSAAGVHQQANEVTIMGIAFNVNDNLSISYEEYENEYLKSASAATGATAGQADVTQDADGIQIAYTMGGATLRISDVSVDNSGGTAGNSEDRTEVSLLMAF